MVQYGTLAYWEELKKKWDGDENLKTVLFKNYDCDMIFRLADMDHLDMYKGIFLDVKNGEISEMRVCDSHEDKAKVVMVGPYGIWKQVVTGELDPTKGLLTRKVKLSGPMGEILKYMKGWMRLIELLQEIDTDWED